MNWNADEPPFEKGKAPYCAFEVMCVCVCVCVCPLSSPNFIKSGKNFYIISLTSMCSSM